jgi:hypothetical protein
MLCGDKVLEFEIDFEKGTRGIQTVHCWKNNFIESIVI